MEYINYFFLGFFFTLGFFVSVVAILYTSYYLIKRKYNKILSNVTEEKYDLNILHDSFILYRDNLKSNEIYENILEVDNIINCLKVGICPSTLSNYNIKKDYTFKFVDSQIKLNSFYKIEAK